MAKRSTVQGALRLYGHKATSCCKSISQPVKAYRELSGVHGMWYPAFKVPGHPHACESGRRSPFWPERTC